MRPEPTALDLVVDENPAPLAAHIEFGPAMHPLSFETRVRVNQYSNVRAIAETVDGLFMVGIGTMRLRAFANPSTSSGAPTLRVRARDTEGNLFERILPTAS